MTGRTGFGKSTFVDAICNFIFDTKWDELTRLRLVNESCDSKKWLTIYTIYSGESNRISYCLNIIDTPGIKYDNDTEYNQRFLSQFHTLRTMKRDIFESINAICLFVKASVKTDLKEERSIIEYFTSLFGADIAPHLLVLATFAYPDNVEYVHKAIVGSGIKFRGNVLKFDNSLIFSNNDSVKIDLSSRSISRFDKTSFLKQYWNMGKERLRNFLNDVSVIEPIQEQIHMTHYNEMNTELHELAMSILATTRSIVCVRERLSYLGKEFENKFDLRLDLRFEVPITDIGRYMRSLNWTTHRLGHCATCSCVEKKEHVREEFKQTPQSSDDEFVEQPFDAGNESSNDEKGLVGRMMDGIFGRTSNTHILESKRRDHEKREAIRRQNWKRQRDEKRAMRKRYQEYRSSRSRDINKINHEIISLSREKDKLIKLIDQYAAVYTARQSISIYPKPLSRVDCVRQIIETMKDKRIPRWRDIKSELQRIHNKDNDYKRFLRKDHCEDSSESSA